MNLEFVRVKEQPPIEPNLQSVIKIESAVVEDSKVDEDEVPQFHYVSVEIKDEPMPSVIRMGETS